MSLSRTEQTSNAEAAEAVLSAAAHHDSADLITAMRVFAGQAIAATVTADRPAAIRLSADIQALRDTVGAEPEGLGPLADMYLLAITDGLGVGLDLHATHNGSRDLDPAGTEVLGQRVLKLMQEKNEALRPSMIVRELGIERSQVSRAIGQLRRTGLVDEAPAPATADGRGVWYAPTVVTAPTRQRDTTPDVVRDPARATAKRIAKPALRKPAAGHTKRAAKPRRVAEPAV